MFNHRAKKPVSLLISSAALVIILYSDWTISRDWSPAFQDHVRGPAPIFHPNLDRLPLRSFREPLALDNHVGSEELSPLIPPINATEQERIAWFRDKLPDYKIFKNDNLTGQFNARLHDFFSSGCDLRFFMTWILPASLFGRRELLAMESLFRVHPNGCLVIISRSLDSTRGLVILEPILNRHLKLLAITPDLDFLFSDTPAEAWYSEIKSGNRDPGEIPLAQNLSNLIRLAILYKYGGVYLDTDFIILRDFSKLRNAVGAQSTDPVTGEWTRINNAAMAFDTNHPLLFKFIQEFALTFDGNKWGHNGPYLVTRVIRRVQGREGYNFTVLNPMAFYPVDWMRIRGLFKKPENQDETRWVTAKLLQLKTTSYGLHLWNKQSKGIKIEQGSIIDRLTSEH